MMEALTNTVNIRAIQHFMYCPRRFALLENNLDWSENAFVVKANLMHEAVHDGSHAFSSSDKVVKSSIAVYLDEPDYDIFGITDCIEFVKSKNGVPIKGLEGKYLVNLVEYKPKPPKAEYYHQSDAIQVFAQKLCVDSIWGCDCTAYIYYSEKRRRVKLPFDDGEVFEHYDTMLRDFLKGMRAVLSSHDIPPKKKSQKCSGCSLSEVCFPKSHYYAIKNQILSISDIQEEEV